MTAAGIRAGSGRGIACGKSALSNVLVELCLHCGEAVLSGLIAAVCIALSESSEVGSPVGGELAVERLGEVAVVGDVAGSLDGSEGLDDLRPAPLKCSSLSASTNPKSV